MRNIPRIVSAIREAGHRAYDFRNPSPGDQGFAWSQIDPSWKDWKPRTFRDKLRNPIASAGFISDYNAMSICNVCVCVLPCGRSAHLEAGYMAGQGKPTAIFFPYGNEKVEPELMYRLTGAILVGDAELIGWLDAQRGSWQI